MREFKDSVSHFSHFANICLFANVNNTPSLEKSVKLSGQGLAGYQ